MIRQPCDQDLTELMALWQQAFGDSKEDTAFYFKHRHQHENMLVYEQGGQIAGMLSLLPIQLSLAGRQLPARYVFAVATKIESRGQGISAALLLSAHALMQAEGSVASILVPAQPSLFTYYQRQGYQTAFYVDEQLVDGDSLDMQELDGQVEVCAAADYKTMRERFFAGSRLFGQWDEAALNFIKISLEGNGAMLRLIVDGQQAFAACELREDVCRVLEVVCPDDLRPQALALLHRHFKAQRYLLRLPKGSLGEQSNRPFGMIHWLMQPPTLAGQPAWLAFAKD